MTEKIKIDSFDKFFCSGYNVNLILINQISKYLLSQIEENKKLRNYQEFIINQESLIFTDKYCSNIPIKDHLIFIQKYIEIDDYILISAVIYIDRFCEHSSIILTQNNIAKIIFAAVLLSIKYNDDYYYENDFYAEIVDLPNKVLNKIEKNFFINIDFNLFIDKKEYDKYYKFISSM